MQDPVGNHRLVSGLCLEFSLAWCFRLLQDSGRFFSVADCIYTRSGVLVSPLQPASPQWPTDRAHSGQHFCQWSTWNQKCTFLAAKGPNSPTLNFLPTLRLCSSRTSRYQLHVNWVQGKKFCGLCRSGHSSLSGSKWLPELLSTEIVLCSEMLQRHDTILLAVLELSRQWHLKNFFKAQNKSSATETKTVNCRVVGVGHIH